MDLGRQRLAKGKARGHQMAQVAKIFRKYSFPIEEPFVETFRRLA